MIGYYRVAGLSFALEIEDSHAQVCDLSNYAPFASEKQDDLLFRVKVECDDVERDSQFKPIFVVETDPSEPRLDLYKSESSWWVEMAPLRSMAPVAALHTGDDFSEAVLHVFSQRFLRFAVDNAAMLLYAFTSAPYSTLEMHSSVVVKDGYAYMFLAKSGTGKSTQSRMWLENIEGTILLNDDNPIVRIADDGTAMVYGSPWSGKTPCYKNQSARVGAFVTIKRSLENRIERLNTFEAYAAISSSSSGFRPLKTIGDGLHSSISTLVMSVPCYTLFCRPDADAALTCYKGAGVR